MSVLFNGQLKGKFKTPVNEIDPAVIANNLETDTTLYDYKVEPNKVPMPLELLKHELDKDVMLQDTILGLCDKEGMPLKWKYLAHDIDDVMDLLHTEDFFDLIPMSEEYTYHVARDWVGCPMKKSEMDKAEYQRKIFERKAKEEILNHEKRIQKAKKLHKESKVKFQQKNTTLIF